MNTNHRTSVLRRVGFDCCSKHTSAIDERLHDEVGHCVREKAREREDREWERAERGRREVNEKEDDAMRERQ